MTPTGEAPKHVNFVLSHLSPKLGIEKAAVELRTLLEQGGISTKLICLGGDSSDRAVAADAIICGPPLRGWRRLNALRARRARTFEQPHAVTLLVGLWAALPYLISGRRRATRLIVWEHSLISQKIDSNGTLRLLAPLAAYLYKRADVVVAVSDALGGDLRDRLGLQNVVVISNTLDESFTDVELTSDRREGLFMAGSLTTTKNQALALRALALLESDSTHLTIAGDGDERPALEAAVRHQGLSERVTFLGHVEASRVMDEMRRAAVFVHTALGETFGYVYFEAAKSATPVVAVRNPVAEDLIPEFVPGSIADNDPESLATRISELLENSIETNAVSRARDARARKFGRESVLTAWRELLGNP